MGNPKTQMQEDRNRRTLAQLSIGLLWVMSGTSISLLVSNWNHNVVTLRLGEIGTEAFKFSLGFRIDGLSTVLLTMVSILGAAIGQFAYRYLDGEKRQTYFYKYLLATIFSVALLVTSSNLITLFGAWLASSLSIHKLLVFYDDRWNAKKAAFKKFAISRLGDLFIVSAIWLTFVAFGTVEFDEIFAKLSASAIPSDLSPDLSMIGVLFALGAMTKSAQFPFHFWLPETMETPTPVSALMHAGVINAGGFLMIRLSPIIQQGNLANILLALAGAVTAVFGALVMITQNDIKKKLAFSTVSQMGMMMCACGLGAYSLALFHIVMHSFYKAHAFLTTGELVEESKKTTYCVREPSVALLAGASLMGGGLIACGYAAAEGQFLPYITYGVILLLGVVQNFGRLPQGQVKASALGQILMVFAVAGGLAVLCEVLINQQLSFAIPKVLEHPHWAQWESLICALVFLIFLAGLWMSSYLGVRSNETMYKIYMYFWNGGYFSARTDTLLNQVYQQLPTSKTFDQNALHAKGSANA